MNDPSDQQRFPNKMISIQSVTLCPPESGLAMVWPGNMMIAIPTKPPAIPNKEKRLGRSLSRVRNNAVQIGMLAPINDATPIGTTFSASAIVPSPMPSIKTPKKIALANSLRDKRNDAQPFRIPMKINKARLAATNLKDIDKSGGIVSIVNAIPIYVVPQATYIMPKPIATLVFIELLTGTHYCAAKRENTLGQFRFAETKPVQI
jgi:hypothetical protein